MRSILYLHPHFTLPGGAGRFVLETAKVLAKRGWRIDVACIRNEPKLVAGYEEINFIELGGPLSSSVLYWAFLPVLFLRLFRFVKKTNPEIIFAQVFPANWWGFLLKIFLRSRVRVVWMCQEPSAFIHSKKWISALPLSIAGIGARVLNPILKILDINLAKNVDGVFSNSHFSKKLALEAYSYPESFVGICYPGVDSDRFYVDINVAKIRSQLVMCARLTKFKNVDRAIRAVKILSNQGFNVTLHIIGEGEEFENLKNLTRQLGLETKVQFRGAVSDTEMVTTLRQSNVLIHAAEEEPFGLAPVEAMACGTPVIAIKGGGPAETIIDKETGYLCDRASEDEIAKAVVWTISNEEKLKSLETRAVDRARLFTWGNAVDKLEGCFESLLKDRIIK